MTTFLLEDALRSAAAPSRRNQFLAYILETQLPGVHFNIVDDNIGPSNATLSPQTLNAGRARLVDGAHESHIVPGYQRNSEGWGSDNAAMKILAQGSRGDPSIREAGYVGQHYAAFHSECLEYLCKNGPNFLMEHLKDKETICSMLLNIAENVKVLTPADEPLPWNLMNMSLWKASLCELIKEMKTVEEKCTSLTCNSGIYVLTTSPYPAFLRALAVEISGAVEKTKFDN